MTKTTRTAKQNNEIFGRFVLILTIALVVLKLTGILTIAWFTVFTPMLVCFALFVITLVTVIVVKAILESKKK